MRVSEKTKQRTRERIVKVAVGLFERKGFGDATTRDISEAAGIATGTLFNYFPSKEAIVVSLINAGWRGALDAYEEAGGLEESLFALGAACLRALRGQRGYLFPAFAALSGPRAKDASGTEVEVLRERHLGLVEDLLVSAGLVRFKSELSLHLYWTLLMGVFTFWAADASPNQEDSLALLDASTRLFVQSVGGAA